MNGRVDLHPLSDPLPFQNALCHGCHDTVVTSLDLLESLGESLVVIVELGGPIGVVISGDEISPACCDSRLRVAVPVAVDRSRRRSVLTFTHAGVVSCLGENFGCAAIDATRSQQAGFDFLSQGWPGEGDDFLWVP